MSDYETELGFPEGFTDREVDLSDEDFVQAVFERHLEQVRVHGRNFHLGLLLAFIALAEDLLGQANLESVDDPLDEFERVTVRGGRRLNTLTLQGPDRAVGIRPFYNQAEEVIRFALRRTSYPNMAPHATQAWEQHSDDLEAVFQMSDEDRLLLAELLWEEILALPEPSYRSADEAEPRPFLEVLRGFESHPGEPGGVVLQGQAYAFYRAESTAFTAIEVKKVGAGGARTGNVGDIDVWQGREMTLTVEVKDLSIDGANVSEFRNFLGNLAPWPNATAIALARDFTEDAASELADQNVIAVSVEELVEEVERWDMPKQLIAIDALSYYFIRVQAHSGLSARFLEFLDAEGLE